jgi:epoxyqueuosine reductase
MTDSTRGDALARSCHEILAAFIADPVRNTLGPDTTEPAWEDYLLGFAAGDDPLFEDLKHHAAPEHWTPAEAFAAAHGDGRGGRLGEGSAPAEGPAPGDATTPAELTVVSWAVCQTAATKAANRRETRMPSEPWARARIYGQEGNRALHLVMVDGLRAAGVEAVAPSLLPAWTEFDPETEAWRSAWSERHVAYVAGLGTFGLSGGLITRKGQAVRFGSVVMKAVIPATPRPYDDPHAYCLFYSPDGCTECVERCPTGSVDPRGRDKLACFNLLRRSADYVKESYGFDGYGCGLCQTGVPCESGIPAGLGVEEG